MTKTPIQLRSAAACKTVLKNLERRGFEAFYCEDKKAALAKVLELIPAGDVVSWGGSVTLQEIGLMDEMRSGRYKVIDRDTAATPEQRTDLLRPGIAVRYLFDEQQCPSAKTDSWSISTVLATVSQLWSMDRRAL